jgi:TatD DNase family protein
MELRYWDMHVHLDFMRDAVAVADEAADLGLGMFAVTVTPEGYEKTARELAAVPSVHVGVGLHPWWVADGRCGAEVVDRAAKLARKARFVGEVGLDLSPKHVPTGSADQQVTALEKIARACAETSEPTEPKLLSIHSVRAAGLTLDVLRRTGTLDSCNCIYHWFSGTSDELHRAVRAGCWFSINEMMLRTRRGREYARQLPADRLLLETDLPPGEDVPFAATEILAQLGRTLAQLEAIRGSDVTALTRDNAQQIMAH